jgi:primosomal protein N' (replication factor Y)
VRRFRGFPAPRRTGSGKTEVYLPSHRACIERGAQALVLVPEISLTPQLESAFARFPAGALALLHSALEDIARTTHGSSGARRSRDRARHAPRGARAAGGWGWWSVDEEHDPSFKQQEGLRYSARDAAVYGRSSPAARWCSGTATPSLETWHNWRAGRYERLELPERAVPGARCRDAPGRHAARAPSTASPPRARRSAAPERGEQSLVFINRRGYAPVLACEACGWTAAASAAARAWCCIRHDRALRCHHCGAESAVPRACPTCGNVDLRPHGPRHAAHRGSARGQLPGARIVRIDRDSARRAASSRARSRACAAARATSWSARSCSPRATISRTSRWSAC